MSENKCQRTCNNCSFITCRKSNYSVYGSDNVYCNHDKSIRLIELGADMNKDIKSPEWCPIAEAQRITDKMNSGEKLTEGEKRTILMRHKPLIQWDDIKNDEIYHIPPLLGEKRRDVLVVWKGEYSCTIRDLSKNYNASETIYPSTLASRFFIKHKIKKIEIKKNV